MEYDFELVKECLKQALEQFYKEDGILFDFKTENEAVCERSMVFRIGLYLHDILKKNENLKEFDIDNEYNRNFEHQKSMYKQTLEKIEEKYTYPDLIVHKRKSNDYNLMIIEFKKGIPKEKDKRSDVEKLKYFTNFENEYKYKFGFYIELHKNIAHVHVYMQGNLMENSCFDV